MAIVGHYLSRLIRSDMGDPEPGALSVAEVAAARGVAASTVRAYAARGQMPRPDGRDRHGHPWWSPNGPVCPWLVAAGRPHVCGGRCATAWPSRRSSA